MKRGTYKGIPSIELKNEYVRCTFLPTYGSKLASLYDVTHDYEWLFQSNEDTLLAPPYGAPFSDYDSSGSDDMFPGIDQGPHPTVEGSIPDHGEVWAMPWDAEAGDDYLAFTVASPRFPYELRKTVRLNGKALEFSYEAINHSNEPFPFIWTPHALLNMNPSTTFEVPKGMTEVMNVEHASQHLGEWGRRHRFPKTYSEKSGNVIDLSRMEDKQANNVEKFYFTEPLTEGWCRVIQGDLDATLTYTFEKDKVPYLGVWKTHGGYRGDYNFALEPCTGVYDDVYVAHKIGKASYIPANGTYTWTFTMEIGGES
ncbi:hypothetical protein N781_02015 [Pontibacillus halophilus JSM 076056 = DSM 19796]|uniref:Galactose mutarotase n=1 Tax=Pontibacillus halophilus JSM 076056 = DSM 19796 TaxID=1385510 RepID=A0A0A5GPS9_9BACI|nr:hypothetical protein N781_02015 [Pontibacillus halophilus JSM 076056 = DSM 19796]